MSLFRCEQNMFQFVSKSFVFHIILSRSDFYKFHIQFIFIFHRLFEAVCQPRLTDVKFESDFSIPEVYIMKPQKYFVQPGED